MNQKYCLVYSTCPQDTTHAELISEKLIIEKLAACVNIVDKISSKYIWDHKLETNHEKLLIIKTRFALFEQVKASIISLHPYECPEIIAIPIVAGSESYFDWLENSITKNFECKK